MSVLETLQVGSVLSYLIALVIPALDAIFPVLPSETAVITLGVTTAGSTDPRIALLVACAAVGAFLGDNLCYLLGRRFGPAVERRFFAGPKGARTRAWAERSLDRYGTQLIIVCRFIPGGRTAVTLTCGLVGYERRRFVAATAVAAVIIGGVSMFGGAGTVIGTVIGALIIAVLTTGLVMLNVDAFWQFIVVGTVVIVAVLIDQSRDLIIGRTRGGAA